QEERKNTIILLKAVQLLQDKGYDISTLVIGDGPELSKLKRYAINNNLINTSFLGNLNYKAVYKNLLESDLLIHPSKSDSWPQVFNEAAFCRNAIFVSEKSGVLNSYTQKYENKVIFESDNFQELSFKIENLINNELLLTELKNATIENAKVNDGEKVIIDMLNLLSK
ncbi:glycosyltransferase, partial [Flavobacteriaceae bacterium]|nr:glycosyltransferase [Flavobacteriaceae bacterium]